MCAAQLAALLKLVFQFRRHRFPVGLVRRVDTIAKGGSQAFVEYGDDMTGNRTFQQLQQEMTETVYCIRGVPLAVRYAVLHREPCPEYIDTGIDQVQGFGRDLYRDFTRHDGPQAYRISRSVASYGAYRITRVCSGLVRGKCARRNSIWSANTWRPCK